MARRRKKGINKEMRNQVKGILLIALAVFALIGLLQAGQTGGLGIVVTGFLRAVAGAAAPALPLIVAFLGLRLILPRGRLQFTTRTMGILALVVLVMIWMHLELLVEGLPPEGGRNIFIESFFVGLSGEGGGVIGGILAALFYFLLGLTGSRIILVALALIALILVLNISIGRIVDFFAPLPARFAAQMRSLCFFVGEKLSETVKKMRERREAKTLEQEETQQGLESVEGGEEAALAGQNESAPKEKEPAGEDLSGFAGGYQNERRLTAEQPADSADGDSKEAVAAALTRKRKSASHYLFPPISLLSPPGLNGEQQHVKNSKERARLLEKTLQSFGVGARVIHVQSGPTVTRFEVQPDVGVKVSKIISLSDDLALNLAAPLVRIEAPIPGKAALGIEVPNKVISLVYLREVMEEATYRRSASKLTVALGKDITGVPVIADLTKMPHLLIAGATGAGKSVCLNTLITSILYKASPAQARFMMIDPKVVELSVYNGIPHLLMPVLTDPRKASLALRNMVREMNRRYELFARLGVRDIGAYNELDLEDEDLEKLALIVVIIDELADLMMIAPGEVEDSIARLAQMSRAAGIHLVVATQRPSVDVLTGIIKANITSRVAFTVSSQVDSRTILDMAGAEKLLGRGDMLYYPVGAVKPFRVQGAYISEGEIKKVTDYIKEQGIVEYEEGNAFLEPTDEVETRETDALFTEAVDLVVRTGQASISLLQRRFRIGYTRAARLIDDLERMGVVGEFEGSKPREVLVTEEQAARICEELDRREK